MNAEILELLPNPLTPQEAADALRMSRSWIYKNVKSGDLVAKRIGTHIFIDKNIFKKFVEAQQIICAKGCDI